MSSSKRKAVDVAEYDTEKEFRGRLVEATRMNKEDLFLFIDDDSLSFEEFREFSNEEIGDAIYDGGTYEKENFHKSVRAIGDQENGSKRFFTLLKRYCPKVESIGQKDVSNALLHRFFRCRWPDEKRFNLARRVEEKFVMDHFLKDDRVFHVKIFKKEVTVDVAFIILSYCYHDYILITTLGLASVSWFRLVLESWPSVDLTCKNIYKIPISVLNKTKEIKFCKNQRYRMSWDFSWRKECEKEVNLKQYFNYVFKHIDASRIVKLDFRDFDFPISRFRYAKNKLGFLKMWEEPRERIDFPKCRTLRTYCKERRQFWKFLGLLSFPNLRVLDCFFLDMHEKRGWNIIDFTKLESLTLQMTNGSRFIFYESKENGTFLPIVEEDYTNCLQSLYQLHNLTELIFQFPKPRFSVRYWGGGEPYFEVCPIESGFMAQSGHIFKIDVKKLSSNLSHLGIFFGGEFWGLSHRSLSAPNEPKKLNTPFEYFDFSPPVSLPSIEKVTIQCHPHDINPDTVMGSRVHDLLFNKPPFKIKKCLKIKLHLPEENNFGEVWRWSDVEDGILSVLGADENDNSVKKNIELVFRANFELIEKRRRSTRRRRTVKKDDSSSKGKKNPTDAIWREISLHLSTSKRGIRVRVHGEKIDKTKYKLMENKNSSFWYRSTSSDGFVKNEEVLVDLEKYLQKAVDYVGVMNGEKNTPQIDLHDKVFF